MKLLVTGAWNCTQEQLSEIRSLGNEIVFMQDEKSPLPDGARDVEGIIGNGIFLYHDIECFEKLRYIQLTSAGFDRVPIDYVNSHDMKIFNARGVYSIPMAEFAVFGVLSLYKKNDFFGENRKNHEWKKSWDIQELFGKTVCVVGCGSVGSEVAKRFTAFGCRVIGVDAYVSENQCFENICELDELDTSLSQSDVVVLTLPLTKETEKLFDCSKFSKMKKNAVLVNIARGKIVDTDALIDAIEHNLIYGAVLDVFENEPLEASSRLWDLQNVVITPHNSFVGEGNSNRLFDVIYQNLRREMKA